MHDSSNPYEPPNRRSEGVTSAVRKHLSTNEVLIILTVIGGLVGLLLPVVEVAREFLERSSQHSDLHQFGFECT
jgi:hypothetical protein